MSILIEIVDVGASVAVGLKTDRPIPTNPAERTHAEEIVIELMKLLSDPVWVQKHSSMDYVTTEGLIGSKEEAMARCKKGLN